MFKQKIFIYRVRQYSCGIETAISQELLDRRLKESKKEDIIGTTSVKYNIDSSTNRVVKTMAVETVMEKKVSTAKIKQQRSDFGEKR